jgi:hypothetical protein
LQPRLTTTHTDLHFQRKQSPLAAGTGKFIEHLAARLENFKIIAVEPHDIMREELIKKRLQGVTVLNGTAEDMSEIADGSLECPHRCPGEAMF